ncbi:hypothetical protein VTN77DRAFT_3336 [Rasamsonia byssochlamydoides]|uniref:uncharacterized protein n=1 Tax=Rasamsonia byssochlamydoides TaxID=89139 RepID=UPI003743E0A9
MPRQDKQQESSTLPCCQTLFSPAATRHHIQISGAAGGHVGHPHLIGSDLDCIRWLCRGTGVALVRRRTVQQARLDELDSGRNVSAHWHDWLVTLLAIKLCNKGLCRLTD